MTRVVFLDAEDDVIVSRYEEKQTSPSSRSLNHLRVDRG